MKRIIPFLLSVSLLYSCHQEEEISLPTDGPVINLAEWDCLKMMLYRDVCALN